MNKIEFENTKIVSLFLEKLELMNAKERSVIINSIDIINHPIFVTGEFKPPENFKLHDGFGEFVSKNRVCRIVGCHRNREKKGHGNNYKGRCRWHIKRKIYK